MANILTFLRNLFTFGSSSSSDRSLSFGPGGPHITHTGANSAGVPVNARTASGVSAFAACVDILCADIGDLPFQFLSSWKDERKGKRSPPVVDLARRPPNENMSSQNWREVEMQDILIHGNAYSYIDKLDTQVVGIYPIPATMVTPQKIDGQLLYFVAGVDTPLTPDQVLHIPGLPFDGIRGLSVIANQARTIGVAIATEEMAARFFSNGTVLGGHLEYPGVLDDGTKDALREMWHQKHQGVGNAYEVPVLAGGLKFVPEGVPPEQAQFLESRKYSAIEICRLPGLRIPPHMIGEMDRATWANIEWQGMAYTRESLRRYITKWENECNRKLLREDEKQEYYCELDLNDLQRGDQTTRYANYATAIQWGWMTPKRVAEIENTGVENASDTPLTPLAYAPTDQVNPNQNTDNRRNETTSTAEKRNHYHGLICDATRRCVSKETKALIRLAKKHLPDNPEVFESSAAEFIETHSDYVRQNLRPVVFAYNRQHCDTIMGKIVSTMKDDSLDALAEAVPQGSVSAVLDSWDTRHITYADKFCEGEFD